MGLMGGLAFGPMVRLGWSACYASVISCFWLPGESCGRVRRAWKAPALAGLGKHSLFPGSRIDGHFLAGCRRPTSGTIDAAGEAYSYISTALAPPPRCALA